MNTLEAIKEQLIDGQVEEVKGLVQTAIDEAVPVERILKDGLISGMEVVGERFKQDEIFVPEVLLAAQAMRAGMSLLEPLLLKAGVKSLGRIVLGTVKGDVHDIGKNLVGTMLKGSGFEVIDLGVGVPPEKFVEAVNAGSVAIVGMSALLTTSMPMMDTTIKALKAAGVRERVKVMIGGAVITQDYANKIGADGYAQNAPTAVDKAKELLHIS